MLTVTSRLTLEEPEKSQRISVVHALTWKYLKMWISKGSSYSFSRSFEDNGRITEDELRYAIGQIQANTPTGQRGISLNQNNVHEYIEMVRPAPCLIAQ